MQARLGGRGARLRLRLHDRQRRQRAHLAARRPDVLAGEEHRHLQADGPVDRHRPEPRRPPRHDPAQRQGDVHLRRQGRDLRRAPVHQPHEPVPDALPGRRAVDGHRRRDREHERRRRGRGGGAGDRRAAQPGRERALKEKPYTLPVGQVLLIRHGETEGNALRIVQRPDIPLSARGVVQAERLARRLAHERVERIVSSDFARAVTTAEHLQRATGAPLAFEPLLQERNFGDLRGTAYAELGFDMFEPDYAPPNGETWPVFHARVDRAWARVQELAAATGGRLAIVTHGLVCRSLAARHLVLADGDAVPERWENTSLTIVDWPAPWRVRLLNCVAHLEGLDAAPPTSARTGP